MVINNLNQLIEFVNSSNSICDIEKVVTTALGVKYCMWSETSIEEFKEVTIHFIETWNSNKINLITNLYAV